MLVEHCYHAQMEPMNCRARLADKVAEIWTSTRATFATLAVRGAQAPPDQIRVHQRAGGSRPASPRRHRAGGSARQRHKQTVKLILARGRLLAGGLLR
jgi:hypothetical protein